MSLPSPLGPVLQLLKMSDDAASFRQWHEFVVFSPNGGLAGRWCHNMIQGEWTFKAEFGRVTFWIKENRDAMAFKLAWGGK